MIVMIQGRKREQNVIHNMPEGPQIGDRIYNIFDEPYFTVHQRDWRLADEKWTLTVWVR